MNPLLPLFMAIALSSSVQSGEFNFQRPSRQDTIEASEELAWKILHRQECRSYFEEVTGVDPIELSRSGRVSMVYPDDWPLDEFIGFTTCTPVFIAIDSRYIETMGPFMGATTIIHELTHAATCDQWWGGQRTEKAERQAVTVETRCASQALKIITK